MRDAKIHTAEPTDGLRCGKYHSGNMRIARDGALFHCIGCGEWYAAEDVRAARVTDDGWGRGRLFRLPTQEGL